MDKSISQDTGRPMAVQSRMHAITQPSCRQWISNRRPILGKLAFRIVTSLLVGFCLIQIHQLFWSPRDCEILDLRFRFVCSGAALGRTEVNLQLSCATHEWSWTNKFWACPVAWQVVIFGQCTGTKIDKSCLTWCLKIMHSENHEITGMVNQAMALFKSHSFPKFPELQLPPSIFASGRQLLRNTRPFKPHNFLQMKVHPAFRWTPWTRWYPC